MKQPNFPHATTVFLGFAQHLGLYPLLCFRVSKHESEAAGRILVTSREVRRGEIVVLDKAYTLGPVLKPLCLGCLLPFKTSQKQSNVSNGIQEQSTEGNGLYSSCENCSFPICSKDCPHLQSHLSQECEIFKGNESVKALVNGMGIKVDEPHGIYLSIGLMRAILQRKMASEATTKDVDLLWTHVTERLV